jgi:hypothetical protein
MEITAVNSSKHWNNTIRTEFKIKKLEDGFATLNVASTFSQKKWFETDRKDITSKFRLWRHRETGQTVFDVNINGIIYSIKDTLRIFLA